MKSVTQKEVKRMTAKLFKDCDIAGGIPVEHRPLPSSGPVYFEGQLVLCLSFQSEEDICRDEDCLDCSNVECGECLDRLRLWDTLSNSWFEPSPEIIRYEGYDVVVIDDEQVYRGIVDNTLKVTLVPGWDSACRAINDKYHLEWKSLQ